MIRLIVIALIIFLLYRAFKRWQANKPVKPGNKKVSDQVKMVPCKVCKLHIPETDALSNNGDYYCCQAHLEQDQNLDQN